MNNKWFHDDAGNISSLRVIVLPAAIIGMITVLSGNVAMFLGLPSSTAAMTAGAGLIATALGAKAWQKHGEKKT